MRNILGTDKKWTAITILGFAILGVVVTLYLVGGHTLFGAYEMEMPIVFKERPEASSIDMESDSSFKEATVKESDKVSIVLGVLHDPIKQDQIQVASITAYDIDGRSWLEGVAIKGTISKGQNVVHDFDGITDPNGRLTYAWRIDKSLEPGLYILDAHGSYQDNSIVAQSLYFLVEPNE